MLILETYKVGAVMYASSAQPEPVKWLELITSSPSCLSLLSYNTVG